MFDALCDEQSWEEVLVAERVKHAGKHVLDARRALCLRPDDLASWRSCRELEDSFHSVDGLRAKIRVDVLEEARQRGDSASTHKILKPELILGVAHIHQRRCVLHHLSTLLALLGRGEDARV